MSAAAPEAVAEVPAQPAAETPPVETPAAAPAATDNLPDPYEQILGDGAAAEKPAAEKPAEPKALTDEQKATAALAGLTEEDLKALGDRAPAVLEQLAAKLTKGESKEIPAAEAAPSNPPPMFDETIRATYPTNADLFDTIEKGVGARVQAALAPVLEELQEVQMERVLVDADAFFAGLSEDQRKQYGEGPTDPESPLAHQKARAAVLDKAEEIAAGRITKGLPVNRRIVLREAWAALNHAQEPVKPPNAAAVTARAQQVTPSPSHKTSSPTAELPDPYKQAGVIE